jgi:hypothetical protein
MLHRIVKFKRETISYGAAVFINLINPIVGVSYE